MHRSIPNTLPSPHLHPSREPTASLESQSQLPSHDASEHRRSYENLTTTWRGGSCFPRARTYTASLASRAPIPQEN